MMDIYKKYSSLILIGSLLFLQSCGVLFQRDKDLKEYQLHKKHYEPYKRKNTIGGYREFIEEHPDNIFVKDAKLEIENLEFAPYEKADSVEAYLEFKIQYPNNRHVSIANARIEQVELKRYEKMDTIEGYREFLSKYPKSNFAVLARERLQELEYRKMAVHLLKDYSFDLLQYRLTIRRLKNNLQEGNSPEYGKFIHQVFIKHYMEKDYVHTNFIFSAGVTSSGDSPEEITERFFKTVIKELLYYLNQYFTQKSKVDGFSFSITYSSEQNQDIANQKESIVEFYFPSNLIKNYASHQISDQECLEQSFVVLEKKEHVEEKDISSLSPADDKKAFNIENIPQERRGYEIMAKFYETPRPYDGLFTSTTRIIDSNEEEIQTKILRKWKQYYGKNGIYQKLIIRMVDFPKKKAEGIRILVWIYTKKDKAISVWVYLPFLKKVVRGKGSRKRAKSPYGNDFEPEDYVWRKLDKDTHHYLKEAVIENKKCYVVESTPEEKDYPYSKRVVWIETERWLPIKIEFYDKKGALLKILKTEWQQVYGFWTWKRSVMSNIQKDHKTIIELKDVRFNVGLKNNHFTPGRLGRTLY